MPHPPRKPTKPSPPDQPEASAAWLDELTPLSLRPSGMWDPQEHPRGEDGRIEDWLKPILAAGARPMYEMEQVLPGDDPENPDSDPILEAVELHQAGEEAAARTLLLRVAERDPRCLDAHAHLGNMAFDRDAERALAHYATGVEIGRRALRPDFKGVLSWYLLDNRPFLRCLHGYALCLWRAGRFEDAERAVTELLWLNPSDNLGARSVLLLVRAREEWRDENG